MQQYTGELSPKKKTISSHPLISFVIPTRENHNPSNQIISETDLPKRFNGVTREADKSLKLDIPLKVDPKFLTVFSDHP